MIVIAIVPMRRLAAVLCGAAIGLPAFAEITLYRCVDANGKVTYSDAKCEMAGNFTQGTTLRIPDSPPPPPKPVKPAPAAPVKKSTIPFYNNGKPPTIPFYYDPKDAPPEHTLEVVEGAIKGAAKAWEAGCNVHIDYMGRAGAASVELNEGLLVSWEKSYQTAHHPSHSLVGIGGTGSTLGGIKLTPRKEEDRLFPDRALHYLRSVITHEMGHVLGLAHNHDDKHSVMSYQRDRTSELPQKPDEADYRDCNFSMQKLYDVEFKPTAEETAEHYRQRMTDREILEKQHGVDPVKR